MFKDHAICIGMTQPAFNLRPDQRYEVFRQDPVTGVYGLCRRSDGSVQTFGTLAEARKWLADGHDDSDGEQSSNLNL